MNEEPTDQEPRVQRKALLTAVSCLLVGACFFLSLGFVSWFIPSHDPTHGKQESAQAKIQSLVAQLTRYKSLGGMYPTQEQGLIALHELPGDPKPKRWSQLIRLESDLLDPWGTKFLYRYPGSHNPTSFDVYSAGPDKQPDTSDDIGNW